MTKFAFAIILILLAPALAFAQAPAKPAPPLKLTPQSQRSPAQGKSEPLWNWSDGAFISAAIADVASTQRALRNCNGCYEAGAVKSQWVRVGIYAGVEGSLKWYEWRHPEDRRKVGWFRNGLAAAIGVLVVNNLRRGK